MSCCEKIYWTAEIVRAASEFAAENLLNCRNWKDVRKLRRYSTENCRWCFKVCFPPIQHGYTGIKISIFLVNCSMITLAIRSGISHPLFYSWQVVRLYSWFEISSDPLFKAVVEQIGPPFMNCNNFVDVPNRNIVPDRGTISSKKENTHLLYSQK
jgi:hypothetical protein